MITYKYYHIFKTFPTQRVSIERESNRPLKDCEQSPNNEICTRVYK